jgi:hypothetical protein
MVSLYKNPKQYAKEMGITERLAILFCGYQLRLAERIEKAKFCPQCGKASLEFELGCYEEQSVDQVYCENDMVPFVNEDGEPDYKECEFHTSNITADTALLQFGSDFDPVWALRDSWLGDRRDWFDYAKQSIIDIVSCDKEYIMENTNLLRPSDIASNSRLRGVMYRCLT